MVVKSLFIVIGVLLDLVDYKEILNKNVFFNKLLVWEKFGYSNFIYMSYIC